MPVYVDDMRAPYGRMVMCHMVADTLAELHAMADRIGLARRWYQGPPTTRRPHYDISLAKRTLAIRDGAQEIRWRDAPAVALRCLSAMCQADGALPDIEPRHCAIERLSDPAWLGSIGPQSSATEYR